MDKVSFAGWPNCLRLANAHAELLVTTDVGPRILSYRTSGGPNVLAVHEDDAGGTGEVDFRVRGGHRFWTSPEDARSYAPDNGPVTIVAAEPLRVVVENAATAPWHIRKTLTITLAADSPAVTLDHRLTNEGPEPVTLAAWALTVMAHGGFEIIPQPPLGQHGVGGFLAERVVVPWRYTDFSDPRWSYGTKFWRLTPQPHTEATKLGFTLPDGWGAWSGGDALFIKTFPFEPGAPYPDFGCNYETFTKGDFLELESLSPLHTLAPGAALEHCETWHLFAGTSAPAALNDASIETWLAPFLAQIHRA